MNTPAKLFSRQLLYLSHVEGIWGSSFYFSQIYVLLFLETSSLPRKTPSNVIKGYIHCSQISFLSMRYPIFSKMTYEIAPPEDIRWASETTIFANLKSFPSEFSICEYEIIPYPPPLCVNPLEKRHILILVIFANDFNASNLILQR